MNPEPDLNKDLNRALDESLSDDVVATTLARTLAAVRARRRRRQATTLLGTVSLVAVALWLFRRPMEPQSGNIAHAPEPPSAGLTERVRGQFRARGLTVY